MRRRTFLLAIALLVVAAAYGPLWLSLGPSDPWAWRGLIVVNSLTCLGFYGSVLLSGRRFNDGRNHK